MHEKPTYTCWIWETHYGIYKRLNLEMHLNLWFKWTSNQLNTSCISSTASHLHAMLMHHFDCIWLLLIVAIHLGRLRTLGFHRISVWRILSLLWATRQATILIIPINPMFLLLHLFIALGSNASNAFATLVEPTSFAWPNLVTVNSRTLQPSIPGSCLSYVVPYPAMHAMLRVVYGLSSGRWTELWECVR